MDANLDNGMVHSILDYNSNCKDRIRIPIRLPTVRNYRISNRSRDRNMVLALLRSLGLSASP